MSAATSGVDEDDVGISFDSPVGAPGGSTELAGGLTSVGPGFLSIKPPRVQKLLPRTNSELKIGDELDALFDDTADTPKEGKQHKKSESKSKKSSK